MTDFQSVQRLIFESLALLESPAFIIQNGPFKGPENVTDLVPEKNIGLVTHTNILTMQVISKHHVSQKPQCKICAFFKPVIKAT